MRVTDKLRKAAIRRRRARTQTDDRVQYLSGMLRIETDPEERAVMQDEIDALLERRR